MDPVAKGGTTTAVVLATAAVARKAVMVCARCLPASRPRAHLLHSCKHTRAAVTAAASDSAWRRRATSSASTAAAPSAGMLIVCARAPARAPEREIFTTGGFHAVVLNALARDAR